MTSRIRLFRTLALTAYLALLTLMLVWQLWWSQGSELSPLFRVLLWIVPLLFPLVGIIRGKPYTHAWANFILMWYFLHSLTLLWVAPEQRHLAIGELLLTTLAFIGCTAYAREQGRALGLGLKKQKTS